MELEWLNYELHPDTPLEGILLADRFGEEKTKGLIKGLEKMGKPYGLEFGELYFMPNSRFALEASEYAKEAGKFECFHEKLFYEHFTNLLDIGKKSVLKKLALDCGMDERELMDRLEKGFYSKRIKEIRKMGENAGVGKTPYFIIEDKFFLERPPSIDDIIEVLKRTGKECG